MSVLFSTRIFFFTHFDFVGLLRHLQTNLDFRDIANASTYGLQEGWAGFLLHFLRIDFFVAVDVAFEIFVTVDVTIAVGAGSK